MLEVVRLGVIRGGRSVLTDVSFSLETGEVVAVLGVNGAGKSTLLAALSGEVGPAAGEVRLDGQALAQIPRAARARRMAVLPQTSQLAFDFRAREVVTLGRLPHRSGAEADREAILSALAQADAVHLAERSYLQLSGGERQRIHLARVLAQITDSERPCLLMDEPTAALDIAHQHLALQAALQVAQRGGVVLVATHDFNLAARYADRVMLLDQGRVAALGRPWDTLQPGIIRRLFGVTVTVQAHPQFDCPLIIM